MCYCYYCLINLNVIAIGAHPDDIEIGCGGTLLKHVLCGSKVLVLMLTKGEKGGDPNIRISETYASLKILKLNNIIFGDFPDTNIFSYLTDVINFIENYVKNFKPDRVYTTSKHDRHQDHIATSIATIAACRNVSQILAYETPSSLNSFKPDTFVDIEDTLKYKVKALQSHNTQEKKNYTKIEAIIGLAKFRGQQSNTYVPVEAFENYKYILQSF